MTSSADSNLIATTPSTPRKPLQPHEIIFAASTLNMKRSGRSALAMRLLHLENRRKHNAQQYTSRRKLQEQQSSQDPSAEGSMQEESHQTQMNVVEHTLQQDDTGGAPVEPDYDGLDPSLLEMIDSSKSSMVAKTNVRDTITEETTRKTSNAIRGSRKKIDRKIRELKANARSRNTKNKTKETIYQSPSDIQQAEPKDTIKEKAKQALNHQTPSTPSGESHIKIVRIAQV